MVQAVRLRPFPFYGLPAAWECRRAIRGSSYGKETGLRAVRLGHSIGTERRPVEVDVFTSRRERGAPEEQKEEIEFGIGLRSSDEEEPLGELEWMKMRIPVDGNPVDFEVIAGRGAEWGAVGAVGDVVVGVVVRNFAMADVVLERVADVEPYIGGRKPR